MISVKVHFHRFEKAQVDLRCALDLIRQHLQDVIALNTALLHILDLVSFSHESPVSISAIICLRVNEVHHFILPLLIFDLELAAQVLLLHQELVVDLNIECIAEKQRVST